MNQAFLSGYLDGLEVNGVEAVLAVRPGGVLRTAGAERHRPRRHRPHDTDDTAQGDPGADDR
ncbi:hypothetical protein ABT270_26220 [Streptomyces sp900105245]|uniref:hypothetical protein n=1 Tax=Streptomyces sp. 900105245 TaxID=3154379 RepID=UPI00332DAFF0